MQTITALRAVGLGLVASACLAAGAAHGAALEVTSVLPSFPIEFASSNDTEGVPEEIIRQQGGSDSVCGNSRSPWTGRTSPDPEGGDKEYLSLGPRNRDGDGIQCSFLEFEVGFDASSLSLLWGSADTYNRIRLFRGTGDGGVLVGTVVPSSEIGFPEVPGDAVSGVPAAGGRALLVTITSDEVFDRAVFEVTNNSPAFEFSNVNFGAASAAGTIDCDDVVVTGDSTVRRTVANVGGAPLDCNPVDFQFGFGDGLLTLLTEPDPDGVAGFLIDVVWGSWVVFPPGGAVPADDAETATLAGAVPLAEHTFGPGFEQDEDFPTYVLDICPGEPILDGGGELIGYDLSSLDPVADDMAPTKGALDFACSAQRAQRSAFDPSLCFGDPPASAVCVGFDEKIYLQGDWFGSRKLR